MPVTRLIRRLPQSCSLPIQQVEELDALARKLRVSKSTLMEEALEPLLVRYGAKELVGRLDRPQDGVKPAVFDAPPDAGPPAEGESP